jgi:hypothetical protein
VAGWDASEDGHVQALKAVAEDVGNPPPTERLVAVVYVEVEELAEGDTLDLAEGSSGDELSQSAIDLTESGAPLVLDITDRRSSDTGSELRRCKDYMSVTLKWRPSASLVGVVSCRPPLSGRAVSQC